MADTFNSANFKVLKILQEECNQLGEYLSARRKRSTQNV